MFAASTYIERRARLARQLGRPGHQQRARGAQRPGHVRVGRRGGVADRQVEAPLDQVGAPHREGVELQLRGHLVEQRLEGVARVHRAVAGASRRFSGATPAGLPR